MADDLSCQCVYMINLDFGRFEPKHLALFVSFDTLRSYEKVVTMWLLGFAVMFTSTLKSKYKVHLSIILERGSGSTLSNTYKCAHINGLISPRILVRSFSNFQQI